MNASQQEIITTEKHHNRKASQQKSTAKIKSQQYGTDRPQGLRTVFSRFCRLLHMYFPPDPLPAGSGNTAKKIIKKIAAASSGLFAAAQALTGLSFILAILFVFRSPGTIAHLTFPAGRGLLL